MAQIKDFLGMQYTYESDADEQKDFAYFKQALVCSEIAFGSDNELFWAILGGSPGDFGVITHYLVETFRAANYIGTISGPNGYKGPHGMKGLWVYTPQVLTKLLQSIAKMSDDNTVSRNYDLSSDFPVTIMFPSLRHATIWEHIQNKIKTVLADEFLSWLHGWFPAVIALYAQWCPTDKVDKYDETVNNWFKTFRELDDNFSNETLRIEKWDENMSKMTGHWLFLKHREFDLPYVKCTYSSNSRSLQSQKWVETMVERTDLVYNPKHLLETQPGENERVLFLKCKLSVQIQPFGGQYSEFFRNGASGSTAYSWRDSTVIQTLDCFHNPDA
ncbi:hypothetical protein K461DRAFT_296649 [Myriangium duriaei CBS 260.36]|uniref:Uncharacterized protein n=1 Tax=Myriangium duriaei CBS 260.36 TaxID=1168546 RepID=A0A9P4IYZ8_9PEZI|nr:hypothetical protein K461DRAFT_296649 [Myriangium duriaei CBS 260.36]